MTRLEVQQSNLRIPQLSPQGPNHNLETNHSPWTIAPGAWHLKNDIDSDDNASEEIQNYQSLIRFLYRAAKKAHEKKMATGDDDDSDGGDGAAQASWVVWGGVKGAGQAVRKRFGVQQCSKH